MIQRMAQVLVVTVLIALATTGEAELRRYGRCEFLNKDFPHGVGLAGARDRAADGNPVRNFTIKPDVYKRNKGLDRDRDRIACERH
jgi:Excalibur calcium-binding domain